MTDYLEHQTTMFEHKWSRFVLAAIPFHFYRILIVCPILFVCFTIRSKTQFLLENLDIHPHRLNVTSMYIFFLNCSDCILHPKFRSVNLYKGSRFELSSRREIGKSDVAGCCWERSYCSSLSSSELLIEIED